MKQPFFILGSGRCGSSHLSRILGEHPKVVLTNEARIVDSLHMFYRFAALPAGQHEKFWLNDEVTLRGIVPRAHVDDFAAEVRRHARGILEGFYARKAAGREVTHWGDKLPDATAARAVLDVLPNTRYLVLVRDPRDTWCSWQRYAQHGEIAATYPAAARTDAHGFAIIWRNLYRETTSRLPRSIHLRYEDLVRSPKATIGRALEHLGLDWDEAITAAIASPGAFRGHGTSDSPGATIGRWRRDLDPTAAGTIERTCGAVMARFEYRRSDEVGAAAN